MPTFLHPGSLNPLRRFAQARRALVQTSRATNAAWYQPAIELETQLHLRVDGESLTGWIFHRKSGTWDSLPEIPFPILSDADERQRFIESILAIQKKAHASALGVVLYVADDFAITEINPELEDPEALPDLREAIIHDPASVIDDDTLSTEDTSWRLFPFPGNSEGTFATAITLSTTHNEFLRAFREAGEAANFPIRTQAVSAPLMALCALPFLIDDTTDKPLVAVLHYPHFTVMGFFNERGDLVTLRSLPHRGQRRPSNLRHATSTTAALLEMPDPNVCVLPLASFSSQPLVEDLKLTFANSLVVLLPWNEHPALIHRGDLPLEGLAATVPIAESGTPLSNNHTFTTLFAGSWASQDFLPPTSEEIERVPSWSEMRLMRSTRHFHLAIAAAVVVLAAWVCLGFIDAVYQPGWTFDPQDSKAVAEKKKMLLKEQALLEQWDNLLKERSKAWSNMELITRMFPADSGVLLKSYSHTAKPEKVPGNASVGLVKTWTVVGFASPESLEHLTTLNSREGIVKVFKEVAEATGNEAYLPESSSRTLVVSIRTEENKRFKAPSGEFNPADETAYPFTFTLNLSQRFESSDSLALAVATPAKPGQGKK